MTSLTQRALGLLAGATLLSGLAAGQAADNCASAPSILGYGTYGFNNSGANTDGPGGACGNLAADVWYAWTASQTGNVQVTTCSMAGHDTVLAAYTGSCGSLSMITCNDDSCGLQSTITFAATAGSTYRIRIGGYNGASGSGSIEVAAGGSGTGGCNNPSSGPDVIVGELTGPSSYGGTGGVSAFAIGTTSCNVGDTVLQWIAGNNQHPVIGQNIYRHKDGRFELLGISWLKHGFTALQGTVCCSCNANPNGSALGVGCSDPYGSGLNGSQSGLGPRFEVNATTGAFLYPYTGQGATGNVIYKRCQVLNTDLDPAQNAGATYYGEGHYISPDDAAAGNQANNASHRRMSVGSFSGGGYNMSFSGSTQREEPAIRAWPDHDPTVILTDVMADGMFILGSNATDNGNGTWHYEYAVHNLFSDRSGGSFSVPVPAGANVTNVGFHDVAYHSGEPYSGTDWSASVAGGAITWSTQTFAQNPNANALRWGTLYNFRFDCDASPDANGMATIGLFKPGGGANNVSGIAYVPDGVTNPNLGTTYCAPNGTNSTGTWGKIAATGSDSAAANNFNLTASDLPANQFGYFITSATQGLIVTPNGAQGNLCLGGQMGRFVLQVQNSGAGGSFGINVDLSGLPAPLNQPVLAGQTWNFTAWYRDLNPGTTSNFTDAVSVLFN